MTSLPDLEFDQLPPVLHNALLSQWPELERQLQQRLGERYSAIKPTLAGVLACSEYVLHWCRRCPDWLVTLMSGEDLWRRYGEQEVKVYKKFLGCGCPPRRFKHAIRDWARLLRDGRLLLQAPSRGRWIRRFGNLIGRLKGSVRYRVMAA